MILGAGWNAATLAVWRALRSYHPTPTPAEFAKARMLEVVAMDRAQAGEGRWAKRWRPCYQYRAAYALASALMGGVPSLEVINDGRPRYRWEPRR